MNSMMPDAPPGAAAMPPQSAPQAAPSGSAMMPAPNAMMGPQGAPAPPTGPPPTPEEIAAARKHVGAIIDGLIHLTSMPRGDLTKDDVFKAASDMISKGAFPTPSARQGLVVELASLPDDEPGLRKALGQYLLTVSAGRQQLHDMFGKGEP